MKKFLMNIFSVTIGILMAVVAVWSFMFLTDYHQYQMMLMKPVFAQMADYVDDSEYSFQYNGIGYKLYYGQTWVPDPHTPKGKISGKIILFGQQYVRSFGG